MARVRFVGPRPFGKKEGRKRLRRTEKEMETDGRTDIHRAEREADRPRPEILSLQSTYAGRLNLQPVWLVILGM